MAEPTNGFFYDMQRGISDFFSQWQWQKDPEFLHNISYRNIVIDSDTPVLVDTQNLRRPYEDCSVLQMVIDRKAEMFANGMWKCVSIDDETKEYTDDEGLKLLRKPNPLQPAEEWLKDWMRYKSVFANVFIYSLRGSKLVLPKSLWYLPSDFMEIKTTGKFWSASELKGVIEYFRLRIGSIQERMTIDEVLYYAERFSVTEGKGISKILGLKYPISNIVAADKTANVISVTQGVKGIWTNEAKDMAGVQKMDPKEKELIEREYVGDRGLYGSKAKIIITNAAMKWNPVGYPVRDLMLIEQNDANAMRIMGSYGMRKECFPTSNGTTYENQNEAEKNVYQSTLQPEADSLGGFISDALGATLRGRKYILDYSWLPIMKEDEMKQEQAGKIKSEKLGNMMRDGVIDRQTYADEMGVELTTEPVPPTADNMGKIPLAIQQLALARERANTAGDVDTFNALGEKINELLERM